MSEIVGCLFGGGGGGAVTSGSFLWNTKLGRYQRLAAVVEGGDRFGG